MWSQELFWQHNMERVSKEKIIIVVNTELYRIFVFMKNTSEVVSTIHNFLDLEVLEVDGHAWGREVETSWSLGSFSAQAILSFCDYVATQVKLLAVIFPWLQRYELSFVHADSVSGQLQWCAFVISLGRLILLWCVCWLQTIPLPSKVLVGQYSRL